MSTIFNKIINKEIPSNIIYEDEDVLAFLDISQATKGHTLVVPKKETESVLTANDDTISKVNIVAAKLARELIQIFDAEGANILTNANEVAGQTVFHYHVHIIPRYKKEELKFSPLENDVDIEEVYEKIRNYNKDI
ncbi:MAG: HIT family protein [Erysipelothrix sp.]|nr:HIT family protein [Erysipelothrix sp.]